MALSSIYILNNLHCGSSNSSRPVKETNDPVNPYTDWTAVIAVSNLKYSRLISTHLSKQFDLKSSLGSRFDLIYTLTTGLTRRQ